MPFSRATLTLQAFKAAEGTSVSPRRKYLPLLPVFLPVWHGLCRREQGGDTLLQARARLRARPPSLVFLPLGS